MTEGEETGNASPRSTRAGVGCDENFPTAFSNPLNRNSVITSFYAVLSNCPGKPELLLGAVTFKKRRIPGQARFFAALGKM